MSCRVGDCGMPVLAKGMCAAHYFRERRGRPLEGEIRDRPGSRSLWAQVLDAAVDIGNLTGDKADWKRAEDRLRMACRRYVRHLDRAKS